MKVRTDDVLGNHTRSALPEGVNWGNVQICAFLHSEAGHPLFLYPIGTGFALNFSWSYELHEDVLGFMWVALCANWLG